MRLVLVTSFSAYTIALSETNVGDYLMTFQATEMATFSDHALASVRATSR